MDIDKELEIKLLFLEEATSHLNTLEAVLLDNKNPHHLSLQDLNAALRAVHSIKGGAGMMGFRVLGDLAHRVEDALHTLKTRQNTLEIDADLHSLLFSAVDWLRQIVKLYSEGYAIDEQWLGTFCYPVFQELNEYLGEPNPENAMTILALESESSNVIPLLFQTEVEGRLQHLESLLTNCKELSVVRDEVASIVAELGGLGEMLQLEAFTQLCESVAEHLDAAQDEATLRKITQIALHTWKRSQALILENKIDSLPTQIDCNLSVIIENSIVLANPYTNVIPAIADSKNLENTLRVPIQQIEQVDDLFGELTIQHHSLKMHIERLQTLIRNLSNRVKHLERENHELRITYDKLATQISTVKGTQFPVRNRTQPKENNKCVDLGVSYYQELHTLSQSVMETLVKIQEITSDLELSIEDTDQVNRLLNKTAQRLYQSLSQVKMRPLSDIVDHFPKALGDMSIDYGKNVLLRIEGADTLIERNILEALNEPLMHLLRNAFDHGIEDPETRRACGKPEQGLIEIKATHQDHRTIITIRDDGHGISLDTIRARALEMGLAADLLAQATDEEILSLIFEPGFSTKDQVTALSGRGIGLDIVRNNLQQVHGDVKVDTILGVSTTFTLTVPLVFSVKRVLVVESHQMILAFPIDLVSEIYLLDDEQVSNITKMEFLNWKEMMVPLVHLNRYLEFNCPRYDNSDLARPTVINKPSVLILEHDNQLLAIQVDRCWGEQEVALQQVEGHIPLPAGFDNCTILGDGRVVALVDVNQLLVWITNSSVTTPQLAVSKI